MNRRRWALLGAAAILVAALVGGRWSAMQTAERAWAETIPNGAAYLHGLAVARLVQWIVAAAALLWGVGHCYLVYRAIGSVQMPRRLGDIEIVEAVPHRLLVAITLIGGVLYGGALAWAIGRVWPEALLAASPPHFGITDSVLHQDLGYYLGELPWARTRHDMLLIACLTATSLLAVLYASIGSIRIQAGRLVASPHARAHLGLTLAGLAVAFAWGAHLDPAETLSGLAGPVTRDVLAVRGPGADVVGVLALLTAGVSALWGWWDRPAVVGTAWGTLLVGMLAAYVILPPATRSTAPPSSRDRELDQERIALEGIAFGATAEPWTPPALPPAVAAATIPVWDPFRLRMRAAGDSTLASGATVSGVRYDAAGHWVLGLAPDAEALLRLSPPPSWATVHEGAWAHAPGALVGQEADSSLHFVPSPRGPRLTWFGAGFLDYAVVDSGTVGGIAMSGAWRRVALAWALQAPELARASVAGRTLLWRRDAGVRFSALAPFASFEPPYPALVGDSLWWLSWGSVEGETFPLVDTEEVNQRPLRYRQPGLIAALNAASGTTRLWLSPRTDSLTAAWARITGALIAPADSLPAGLRAALRYPAEAFAIQARILAHTIDQDSIFHWQPVGAEPFTLAAPQAGDTARSVWLVQAFVDSLSHTTLGGVLAGVMGPDGPHLSFWTPFPPRAIPIPLGSDPERRAGVLRVWPTEAGVLTVQGRFWQPQAAPASARLDSAFVSLGTDVAGDVTAPAALRTLLRGPDQADGTPAAALRRIRALFARMDSALVAGRVARFGALYDSLRALLRGTSRGVAPPARPR